ncbi:MAG TPA: DinB family protein [Chloroflexaceae bacterium]|nr:DinB family protein [Chloroflexaceae bacterium]
MADLPPAPLTRRDLLLAQYDTSYEYLIERLAGLSDAEYHWEPVAGCWGVRRRAEAVTPHALGAGEWVLDYERAELHPAPVTTIAWRLCHIVYGQRMRHDYTFGARSLQRDSLALPADAAGAVAWLAESHAAWRAGLAGLRDEDLDVVGLSSYPWGLDPQLPFGAIWWWTNRELIHHGAEIGVLRDLWAARDAAAR